MDGKSTDKIFAEEELQILILALMKGNARAGRSTPESEILRFVGWAEMARIEAAILATILSGKILVTYEGEEIILHPDRELLT